MKPIPPFTSRRDLVRAGAAAATVLSYRRILGAADTVNAALIGCGGRGMGALFPGAVLQPEIRFVAAADVFQSNLDKGLSQMAAQGFHATGYGDFRRVLERRDVDVVFVATPDHWHAPITVAACQAGKDVYVEKPLANNLADCLTVVDAAAKYRRIVQVGLQQRSMKIFQEGLRLLKEGAIGRVRRGVIDWGGEGGGGRGGQERTTVPEGLDWEMFQGPAPRRPYVSSRQTNWRSYWDYGSGSITDLAVHMLDVFHWFIGADTPGLIFGAGYSMPGRSPERVPEYFDLIWRYDQQLLTYSSHNVDQWGIYFWGDTGVLHVNRSVVRVRPLGKAGATPVELKDTYTTKESEGPHIRNFLDCVRSRQKPNCDAETGYRSTAPGLIAALSVRTGKSYRWDGVSPQPA